MRVNESEIYESIKSLMNYLKTQVCITPGEVLKIPNSSIKKTMPGHIIKITVSNIAPMENSWPIIVFTGVCLVHKASADSKYQFEPDMRRVQYSVDVSQALEKDVVASKPELSREMTPLFRGADRFPSLTPDEEKHGYSLFPGQKIVFEIGLIGEVKPNMKDLNLWVQGNLSRRHLFHTIKPII